MSLIIVKNLTKRILKKSHPEWGGLGKLTTYLTEIESMNFKSF